MLLDRGIDVPATQQRAGELAMALLKEDGEQLPEAPTWQDLQKALRTRIAAWDRTGTGCRDGVTPPDPGHVAAICAVVSAWICVAVSAPICVASSAASQRTI